MSTVNVEGPKTAGPKKWHGVDRQGLDWFPSINSTTCTGCGLCLLSCGNGVFQWDRSADRPVVFAEKNCMVGCTTCAKVCPEDAITFPSDAKRFVRQVMIQRKVFPAIRKELDERLSKFPDHALGGSASPPQGGRRE